MEGPKRSAMLMCDILKTLVETGKLDPMDILPELLDAADSNGLDAMPCDRCGFVTYRFNSTKPVFPIFLDELGWRLLDNQNVCPDCSTKKMKSQPE
jgi:rubredoxin